MYDTPPPKKNPFDPLGKDKNKLLSHENTFVSDVRPEVYFSQELKAAERRARDLEGIQHALLNSRDAESAEALLNALALTNEYRKILGLKRSLTAEWWEKNRRSRHKYLARYFRRYCRKQLLQSVLWIWLKAVRERPCKNRKNFQCFQGRAMRNATRLHTLYSCVLCRQTFDRWAQHMRRRRRTYICCKFFEPTLRNDTFRGWRQFVQSKLKEKRMLTVRKCFDDIQAQRYDSLINCKSLEDQLLLKTVLGSWRQIFLASLMAKCQQRFVDLESNVGHIMQSVRQQTRGIVETFLARHWSTQMQQLRIIVAFWRLLTTSAIMIRSSVERRRAHYGRVADYCDKARSHHWSKRMCFSTWHHVGRKRALTRTHVRHLDYLTSKHDVHTACVSSRLAKLIHKYHYFTLRSDAFQSWRDACVQASRNTVAERAQSYAATMMGQRRRVMLLVIAFYQWTTYCRERGASEVERAQKKEILVREELVAGAVTKIVARFDARLILTRALLAWRMGTAQDQQGAQEARAVMEVRRKESQNFMKAAQATTTRFLHVVFCAWFHVTLRVRTQQAHDAYVVRYRKCTCAVVSQLLGSRSLHFLRCAFREWAHIRQIAKSDATVVRLCAQVEHVRQHKAVHDEKQLLRVFSALNIGTSCGPVFLAWRTLCVERLARLEESTNARNHIRQCIWESAARSNERWATEFLRSILVAWHTRCRLVAESAVAATALRESARLGKFVLLYEKQNEQMLLQMVFSQWQCAGVGMQQLERLRAREEAAHKQKERVLVTTVQSRGIAAMVSGVANVLSRMVFSAWSRVVWRARRESLQAVIDATAARVDGVRTELVTKRTVALNLASGRALLQLCVTEWRVTTRDGRSLRAHGAAQTNVGKLQRKALDYLCGKHAAQWLQAVMLEWRACVIRSHSLIREESCVREVQGHHTALMSAVGTLLISKCNMAFLSFLLLEWRLFVRRQRDAVQASADISSVAHKALEPFARALDESFLSIVVVQWCRVACQEKSSRTLSTLTASLTERKAELEAIATASYSSGQAMQTICRAFGQWRLTVEDGKRRCALERIQHAWAGSSDLRRVDALSSVCFSAWARETSASKRSLEETQRVSAANERSAAKDRAAIFARVLERCCASSGNCAGDQLALLWKSWINFVIDSQNERTSHCYYERLFLTLHTEQTRAKMHILFRCWVTACIHSVVEYRCNALGAKCGVYAELVCGTATRRRCHSAWTKWCAMVLISKARRAKSTKMHSAASTLHRLRACVTLSAVFRAWLSLAAQHAISARVRTQTLLAVERWSFAFQQAILDRTLQAWVSVFQTAKREASFSRREQVFHIANSAMQRKTENTTDDSANSHIKAMQRYCDVTRGVVFSGWRTHVVWSKQLGASRLCSDRLLHRSCLWRMRALLMQVFDQWVISIRTVCKLRIQHDDAAMHFTSRAARSAKRIAFAKWRAACALRSRSVQASRMVARILGRRRDFADANLLRAVLQLWKKASVFCHRRTPISVNRIMLSQFMTLWHLWCKSVRAERTEERMRQAIAAIHPKLTSTLDRKYNEATLAACMEAWLLIVRDASSERHIKLQEECALRRQRYIENFSYRTFTFTRLQCSFHAWKRQCLQSQQIHVFAKHLNAVRSRVCSKITMWLKPTWLLTDSFREWHQVSLQRRSTFAVRKCASINENAAKLHHQIGSLSQQLISFRTLRKIIGAWEQFGRRRRALDQALAYAESRSAFVMKCADRASKMAAVFGWKREVLLIRQGQSQQQRDNLVLDSVVHTDKLRTLAILQKERIVDIAMGWLEQRDSSMMHFIWRNWHEYTVTCVRERLRLESRASHLCSVEWLLDRTRLHAWRSASSTSRIPTTPTNNAGRIASGVSVEAAFGTWARVTEENSTARSVDQLRRQREAMLQLLLRTRHLDAESVQVERHLLACIVTRWRLDVVDERRKKLAQANDTLTDHVQALQRSFDKAQQMQVEATILSKDLAASKYMLEPRVAEQGHPEMMLEDEAIEEIEENVVP